MAASMVPLNIVNALVKAVEYLGASDWTPTTLLQQTFLDEFYAEKDNLHLFNKEELRAWVDTVAANLNRILAAEGFSLRFDPFNPGEFGVLSILDVSVTWLKEGKVVRDTWPSVVLKDSAVIGGKHTALFSGFATAEHSKPIASIPTKSGDTVFMTIADGKRTGFLLMDGIDRIRKAGRRAKQFSSLVFPMVDFEETKSLDWLVGLSTTGSHGRSFEIARAAQQTKFKMNHTGARVKDAVTLVARGFSAGPPPLVIDKPFFLWIERPGLGKPIFYAYFDQSVWKDPGTLDM